MCGWFFELKGLAGVIGAVAIVQRSAYFPQDCCPEYPFLQSHIVNSHYRTSLVSQTRLFTQRG